MSPRDCNRLELPASSPYRSGFKGVKGEASGRPKTDAKRPINTRTVAQLTPLQLERKRQNDRDAQRAIRARTKDHISELEQRVKELEGATDPSGRVAIERLSKENRLLRAQLHDAKCIVARQYNSQASQPYGTVVDVFPSTSIRGPSSLTSNMLGSLPTRTRASSLTSSVRGYPPSLGPSSTTYGGPPYASSSVSTPTSMTTQGVPRFLPNQSLSLDTTLPTNWELPEDGSTPSSAIEPWSDYGYTAGSSLGTSQGGSASLMTPLGMLSNQGPASTLSQTPYSQGPSPSSSNTGMQGGGGYGSGSTYAPQPGSSSSATPTSFTRHRYAASMGPPFPRTPLRMPGPPASPIYPRTD